MPCFPLKIRLHSLAFRLHYGLTTILSLFPADKGLPHRPRPASPFSTDGSTVGTHSLGHQRAPRPTRKHKGPGTAPHRRDASADGEL